MKSSGFLQLNSKDLIHSLILMVITAVLSIISILLNGVLAIVQGGAIPTATQIKIVVGTALLSAFGNLFKRLLTNMDGDFGKNDITVEEGQPKQ